MRNLSIGLLATAFMAVFASAVQAGPTDEQKCWSQLQQQAGRYDACMRKASAKYSLVPDLGKFQLASRRCLAKYAAAWPKVQRIDAVPCNEPQRFVDNGDGTVTDSLTGLVWERKDSLDSVEDPGNPHDADNAYTWSTGQPYLEDGTAFTSFLAALNSAGGFAGSYGWRLPTWIEFASILNLDGDKPYACSTDPCLDPTFGPTGAPDQWSGSRCASDPSCAWSISFGQGSAFPTETVHPRPVRAVRGGW